MCKEKISRRSSSSSKKVKRGDNVNRPVNKERKMACAWGKVCGFRVGEMRFSCVDAVEEDMSLKTWLDKGRGDMIFTIGSTDVKEQKKESYPQV